MKQSAFWWQRKQPLEKKEWSRIDVISLILLNLLVLLFCLLTFNRFASDLLGWNVMATDLLESGKMVYRDFFYYLPPGYLIQCEIMKLISGSSFLGFRFLGILERLLIMSLQFIILRRFFKTQYVFIACLVSCILYGSTLFDIFGDYNQSYRLFLLCGIFCAIKFGEHLDDQSKHGELRWIFFCGLFLGILFLYKQSLGVIAPFFLFVALIVICIIRKIKVWWKYALNAIGGFLVFPAICSIWLLCNNAFIPFVEQVFINADSKGEVGHVLFAFWGKLFTPSRVIIFVSIAALITLSYLFKKRVLSCFLPDIWVKIILIFFFFISIHYINREYFDYLSAFSSAYSTSGFIWLLEGIIVFAYLLVTFLNSTKTPLEDAVENRTVIYGLAIFSVAFFVAIIVTASFTPNAISELTKTSEFYQWKADFPIYAFMFIMLLMPISFAYYAVTKKPFHSIGFMLMLVGLFAGAYESGMTSTTSISYYTAILSFPFIISMMFTIPVRHMFAKNAILAMGCVIICCMCLAQKIDCPYNWWGWVEKPITTETNYTIDIDKMEGFRVPKRTKVILEEVTKLVEKNSDEDSFVLTFPHVKMFNILANRYNQPTKVVSYFFDVCPDKYAIEDAKIIRENPPEIIVWCDVEERCWTTHERLFRGGQPSGQREIEAWFNEVSETEYTKVGSVYNLSVYKLNDGTPINYQYFADEGYDQPIKEEIDANDLSFSLMGVAQNFSGLLGPHTLTLIKILFIGLCLLLLIAFAIRPVWWKLFLSIIILVGHCIRITPVFFLGIAICIILFIYTTKRKNRSPSDYFYFGLMVLMVLPAILGWTTLWRELRYVSLGAMEISLIGITIQSIKIVLGTIQKQISKKRAKKS